MASLSEINRLGQSIWLDNLSRTMLREGTLSRLIDQGLGGVTSNPTIFHKALTQSPYYRDDLQRIKNSGLAPSERIEALFVPDVREACDLFNPLYMRSGGQYGYVSLEVSPKLAFDSDATIAAARHLHAAVNRPNLLVKVPATPAGLIAIEELLAQGINVNVTLIFSLAQTAAVQHAYLRGLRRFLESGTEAGQIKSVASLFLSRVDTMVDKLVPEPLRGKTAVAVAKLAYRNYLELFHCDEFRKLGARPQHLLWASTGTKNPAYSDLCYVEPLIGPETVNTLPDATLAALIDHGRASTTLQTGIVEAQAHFAALENLGIDMERVGQELQDQGVKSFDESYSQLLELVSDA